MNPNEPNTEPITEVTEAPMETKEALIDTNETDIEPISFSIEDQPKDQSTVEPEQDLLEKPAPIKKQRTEKQIQAFRKAQEALKAKRFLRKQEKESAPKPKRGRPPKKILPIEEKEDEDEEEDEEDEEDDDIQEEVYITTRRKGSSKRPKQKPKPKRRIVYVSESSSSEESESEDEEEHRNAWSHAPVNVSPYAGLRFL